MRKILALVLLAALPAFANTPGFARVDSGSARLLDMEAGGPVAPRDCSHSAGGFGRWSPDAVIECFSGCDAGVLP